MALGELADAIFLGIVVANAAIGSVQEIRAKLALERLAALVAPRARVLRSGRPRLLGVEAVVVGDRILLEPGDQVVADGDVVSASALEIDESILTGESAPVGRAGWETPSSRARLRSRAPARTSQPPSATRATPSGSPARRARSGTRRRRSSAASTG